MTDVLSAKDQYAMTIKLACKCGARLKADDNQRGKTLHCPMCKATIVVPDEASRSPVAAPPPPSNRGREDNATVDGLTHISPVSASASKIPSSLIKRAKSNDTEAIVTMFRQFAPDDEQIYFAQYLGVEGFLGLGAHSFGCLTNRRVASIRIRPFGEVVYQDGFLEYLNSSVVYQPSKLLLYVLIVLFILLALPSLGITLLLIPLVGRIFFAYKKSGVVFVVKDGIYVYFFTNRDLIGRASQLIRESTKLRDERIKIVGTP